MANKGLTEDNFNFGYEDEEDCVARIFPYDMLQSWYWNPKVKFKIIKYTKNRAMDFIASKRSPAFITTRSRRCHSVQHFDMIMKSLNAFWVNKIYNMYYSMAQYRDGIPFSVSTFNLKQRDLSAWNMGHYKLMSGYDFFIDIDAPDHEHIMDAFDSAIWIRDYLDNLDFPYFFRFSGKGFHFVTPYMYFNHMNWSFNPNNDDNIYEKYRKIALHLHDKFTEFVDTRVYDSRRVLKIPYSLAVYKERIMVCAPIVDDKVFDVKDYVFTGGNMEMLDYYDILRNIKGNINKLLKKID